MAGDKIYIDDGLLSFTVLRSNLESVECVIDNSGILGNRKGINLSFSSSSTTTTTTTTTTNPTNLKKQQFLRRRDREDLELARELNVEFVTVSCVRNVQDIEEIFEIIKHPVTDGSSAANEKQRQHPIKLLAKIENKSGLESFEAILAASDGIIIDRGYLGVEIDLCSISTIQKLLVQGCTMAGKSVLIANHILESMKDIPRPSRSEASDIASTVFLGGDGFILSSETAIGSYPIESLQWLRRICQEAETHLDHLDFQLRMLKNLNSTTTKPIPISESIASSTVKCAREVDASCIIVSTEGGGMARLIAKYRPSIPIIAGCGDDRIAAQLAASFGIIPIVVKCDGISACTATNSCESISACESSCKIDPSVVVYSALKYAANLGLIDHGNRVVVASGQVDGFLDGSSTFMQVFTLGEDCQL